MHLIIIGCLWSSAVCCDWFEWWGNYGKVVVLFASFFAYDKRDERIDVLCSALIYYGIIRKLSRLLIVVKNLDDGLNAFISIITLDSMEKEHLKRWEWLKKQYKGWYLDRIVTVETHTNLWTYSVALYGDEVLKNQVEQWLAKEISRYHAKLMYVLVNIMEYHKMLNFQKFQNGKCSISTHYRASKLTICYYRNQVSQR